MDRSDILHRLKRADRMLAEAQGEIERDVPLAGSTWAAALALIVEARAQIEAAKRHVKL